MVKDIKKTPTLDLSLLDSACSAAHEDIFVNLEDEISDVSQRTIVHFETCNRCRQWLKYWAFQPEAEMGLTALAIKIGLSEIEKKEPANEVLELSASTNNQKKLVACFASLGIIATILSDGRIFLESTSPLYNLEVFDKLGKKLDSVLFIEDKEGLKGIIEKKQARLIAMLKRDTMKTDLLG